MLAKNINVEEALFKTKKLSREPVEEKDKFSMYSPIYIAPTENIKDMINLYKNVDSALTTLSHGMFLYELILNGTKKIDCFDCNVLQYLYFELVDAAIKNLDYEDFIENFTAIKQGNLQYFHRMFGEYMFFDLLEYIEEPAAEYWCSLFKKTGITNLMLTNVFRSLYILDANYLKKLSSVYKRDNFYKLKELLKDDTIKINHHICDISQIPTEFKDKYDLIIFSNIFQYFKNMKKFSDTKDIYKFVTEKVSSMLNDKGKIQVGYGFELIADTVSRMKDREYSHMQGIEEFFANMQMDKAINDFIPKMLTDYNDFDYDYIKGVEPPIHHKPENIILTYRKK